MRISNVTVMLGFTLASLALPISAWAEDIKIGLIAPMSGAGAAWGIAGAEGARMAVDEANAAGGIDVNGEKQKVDFIVYDDKYQASEAIAAYNRLINEDGAKFMMTMSSASTMAIKQNVEDDDVFLLTSSYSSKVVDVNSKHLMRLLSTPKDYIPAMISWMQKNIKGNRVSIINPNDETGWDITNTTVEDFKKGGFDVVSQDMFERSLSDFQPMLTKILANHPDIIELGATSPATAGLIVRQARELGYKNTFSAFGGSGPREVVASAGADAANGMVCMLYADPKNARFQEISAKFKQKIGQNPNEFIVSYYDGMRVLLKAIALSGDPEDVDKVAASMSKALPMSSLQGTEMTFGGKDTIGKDAQIMTTNYIGVIKDGAPVAVGLTK